MTPTVPTGKEVVDTTNAVGLITIESDDDTAVTLSASVTWKTSALAVPIADGVPEITPAEVSVNPAGSAPDFNVHVYGAVPFAAVNVVL